MKYNWECSSGPQRRRPLLEYDLLGILMSFSISNEIMKWALEINLNTHDGDKNTQMNAF